MKTAPDQGSWSGAVVVGCCPSVTVSPRCFPLDGTRVEIEEALSGFEADLAVLPESLSHREGLSLALLAQVRIPGQRSGLED